MADLTTNPGEPPLLGFNLQGFLYMALYMIYDVCSHFNSLKFSSFISNLDIRSLVLPKFSRRFHELFTAGLFAASSYVLLRMGAEEPIDKKWF